ncbi:DNA repair protein Rad26, partial [Rasamsonia emersonii CBS 393.64]
AYKATQAQQHHASRTLQDDTQFHNGAHRDPSLSLTVPLSENQGLSSEYGDMDVGELDAMVLEDGDEVLENNGAMEGLERHEAPIRQPERHPDQPTIPQPQPQPQERHYASHNGGNVRGESHSLADEVAQLRARVEELSRQNERMEQELVAARNNAQAKAGEAAILRSNQANLVKEYDRQIAALQKRLTEETEKHKGALQAAEADKGNLATENAFLRQDLREETLKLHTLKAKNKAEEKAPPVTPKKTRVLPFRDGFEDDEMAVSSPTKSPGGRSRRGTPVVPGKRKRKASDDNPIPIASLELSPAKPPAVDEARPVETEQTAHGKVRPTFGEEDWNLQYMQRIWNHRTPPNTERDIEVMARMAFPSEPGRKLSSIVLEEASVLGSGNYAVGFANIIISLWSRALKEKFYQPIPMFMAIIKFILLLDTASIAPKLIENLVPVLQVSVEVNATPRFEHSPVSSRSKGQIRQTPRSELHDEVDSTEALEILYLIATTCRNDESLQENFWRSIRFDFILTMLNCHQLVDDIIITLNILPTSIRPNSFGSIQETEEEQRKIEGYLIDRVANLFSENIQVDEGREPYRPSQICEMRLEALAFFEMLAFSAPDPAKNHGNAMIANHPLVLARLFRSMHDELDALYTEPPEHKLRTALVNRLMHLIYGVIQNNGGVDLHSKLRLLSGATQKYRIVLSRLAFSEGVYLESGISEETMEMARRLLEDEDMDPEEAEAIFEAFPSGGRLSSMDDSQQNE